MLLGESTLVVGHVRFVSFTCCILCPMYHIPIYGSESSIILDSTARLCHANEGGSQLKSVNSWGQRECLVTVAADC
jgi:hypothetical protein